MDDQNFINKFENVFKDTFNLDIFKYEADLISADIPGWDSLSHTILIFNLSDAFNINFENELDFQNLGDLFVYISSKAKKP